MTFVRKKKVKRYEYYQLVESHRVDGKPRQRVIMHLGKEPTVDAALENWPKEIKYLRRRAKNHGDHYENMTEEQKNQRYFKEKFKEIAESAEMQADALQTRLNKLRNLRKSGVA
jgi:predicted patatin/cPLA2 family phospholipase